MANLTQTAGTMSQNLSSTATDTDVVDDRSLVEIVLLSTVVGVILITSLFGNLLVIVCIRWDRRLRSETGNVFLVNLSLTDMTSAAIVMTSSFMSLNANGWPYSDVWCDVICIMNYVLIIVSMLTLCFVSLDRYAAVIHALKYHMLVTKKKAMVLIAFAWLQGLTFGLTPALLNWVKYDYWEMVCAIDWARDSYGTVIYVLFAFILCFVTPGIVLVVAYFKVMAVAKSISPITHMPKTGTFLKDVRTSCIGGEKRKHRLIENDVMTHADEETWSVGGHSKVVNVELRSVVRETSDSIRQKDVDEQTTTTTATTPDGPAASTSDWNANRLGGVAVVDFDGKSHCEERRVKGSEPEETDEGVKELPNGAERRRAPPELRHSLTEPYNNCPSDLPPERTENYSTEVVDSTTSSDTNSKKCLPNIHVITPSPVFKDTSSTVPKVKVNRYSSSSKAIRSLMIVVVAFFICMTPFCITKVYKVIMQNEGALPGYVNVIATIFQFCSSAINPLIYGIFRKDFRHVFKRLLKKWFCSILKSRSKDSDTNTYSY